MAEAATNTDRVVFQDSSGTVHITAGGGLGINVGGMVIVLPVAQWHALAHEHQKIGAIIANAMQQEAETLALVRSQSLADGMVEVEPGHFVKPGERWENDAGEMQGPA
jgi:hypothetical protein